jgi:hypothetical protein
MSDKLNSVLKAAEPAKTNPVIFGLSSEMKWNVQSSATFLR